jgi:hypothetical protein
MPRPGKPSTFAPGIVLLGAMLGWAGSAAAEPIESILARIQSELVQTGQATIPSVESLAPADGNLTIQSEESCVRSRADIPVTTLDWRSARMFGSPNKTWYVEVPCRDHGMCIEAMLTSAPDAPADCPALLTDPMTIGTARLNLIETDSKTARLVVEWLKQAD